MILMKSSEVCIKTNSIPDSLPLKGLVTMHTSVNWTIALMDSLVIFAASKCLVLICNELAHVKSVIKWFFALPGHPVLALSQFWFHFEFDPEKNMFYTITDWMRSKPQSNINIFWNRFAHDNKTFTKCMTPCRPTTSTKPSQWHAGA